MLGNENKKKNLISIRNLMEKYKKIRKIKKKRLKINITKT